MKRLILLTVFTIILCIGSTYRICRTHTYTVSRLAVLDRHKTAMNQPDASLYLDSVIKIRNESFYGDDTLKSIGWPENEIAIKQSIESYTEIITSSLRSPMRVDVGIDSFYQSYVINHLFPKVAPLIHRYMY